jgi:hypothetical protein
MLALLAFWQTRHSDRSLAFWQTRHSDRSTSEQRLDSPSCVFPRMANYYTSMHPDMFFTKVGRQCFRVPCIAPRLTDSALFVCP